MSRRDATGRARGTTLLEVMVAVAIAGLVLLAARALTETLSDATSRIRDQEALVSGPANAESALHMLADELEVGREGGVHFTGTERTAAFGSWCATVGGWLEPCSVSLSIADSGAAPLIVQASNGDHFTFPHDGHARALRYLSDARNGGHWVTTWGTAVDAPLAIGIVYANDAGVQDTVMLRIGERG